jgi:MAE_28990/MAE_18760-like HEPN
MSGLLTEYEAKVSEILVYFDFLENLLEKDARLHFPRGRKLKFADCGDELLKILKANAFLLMYNLIESSIRNGVSKIYDAVRADGLSYTGVCDELRTIWTHQQFVPDEGRKSENSAKRLMELIAFVLDAELISLDARDLPIAGNVDADQIRILAQRYGFTFKASAKLRGGNLLKRVRDERNSLAHGYKSFAECGRDLTYEGLLEIQKQVIPFLRQVLRGIDRFVSKRGYAA